MIRNQTDDIEKENLLNVSTNLSYGSNLPANDDQVLRSPSVADILDDKPILKREESRLDWAKSSWMRWIHLLMWWWLNPILNLAYNQEITSDDLEEVPAKGKCEVLKRKLLIYDWSKTVAWRIILHAFRKETIYSGFILLLQITVEILQPIAVRSIIQQFTSNLQTSDHLVLSIMLAIGLSLCTLLRSFCSLHLLFRSTQIGMRIRNALSSTIYQQLLSLNTTSLQQTTSSQILNLLVNDVSRFEDLYLYIHYLWGGPLEGIITMGLLIWIIGLVPAAFSFAVLLVIMPLQLVFIGRYNKARQQAMIIGDKRIRAYSEILDGCHIMKMYNWEKTMEERVLNLRKEEMKYIKSAQQLRSISQTIFFLLPSLMALTTFVAIWLFHFSFDPANIFTALIFFGQMQSSVFGSLPLAVERATVMLTASRRIDQFMRLKNKPKYHKVSTISPDQSPQQAAGTILISNGSFSWGDNVSCLSSIDIDIKSGQLVGIVGSTGSGKSSFLAALLGDMNVTDGTIQVTGSLSYDAQSKWIVADTLRANILLGKTFDQERYNRILRACCLNVDFETFGKASDLTMIGEKGVTLSVGQKARISLARALYVDADIYLLDDPFSAINNSMAKKIFDNCIGPEGLLKDKTRLLVTHQTHFLTSSDQCIVFENGRIRESGLFGNLSLGREFINVENTKTRKHRQRNAPEETTKIQLSEPLKDTKPNASDQTTSNKNSPWSVWYRFFTPPPSGVRGLIILVVIFVITEVINEFTVYRLSLWTQQSHQAQQNAFSFFYVFLGLTLLGIVATIVRGIIWVINMIRSAANEHNCMLQSVLRTSMRFFEINSAGGILNRASRDQYVIDELLPMTLLNAAQALSSTIGSLILIILLNPFIIFYLLIIQPYLWYVRRYFIRLNRQLRQLENVSRSFVYAFYSSSLNGLSTIRALKLKDDLLQALVVRIDDNTRSYLLLTATKYWFGLRLAFIASLFVLVTALICIIRGNKITSAEVALILTMTLTMNNQMRLAMQQFVEGEGLMASTERVQEFSKLPAEEDNGGKEGVIQIPSNWPERGTIEFQHYTLRYRPELQPVLSDLNISINSNEKIGIVGRTGAGKTTLVQSLFRLIGRSTIEGTILIDDIDISRLTLSDLRSHLTIIPQTPIMFSDTLRYNLDPNGIYSDEACLNALEDVQMKNRVCDHPDGLKLMVTESGKNFSVGECQLICLARAILRQSKIVLIDEATANIDERTDTLIQTIITKKFRDCTILTIAHRTTTLAESDRILVMDNGEVVDFDVPSNIF